MKECYKPSSPSELSLEDDGETIKFMDEASPKILNAYNRVSAEKNPANQAKNVDNKKARADFEEPDFDKKDFYNNLSFNAYKELYGSNLDKNYKNDNNETIFSKYNIEALADSIKDEVEYREFGYKVEYNQKQIKEIIQDMETFAHSYIHSKQSGGYAPQYPNQSVKNIFENLKEKGIELEDIYSPPDSGPSEPGQDSKNKNKAPKMKM